MTTPNDTIRVWDLNNPSVDGLPAYQFIQDPLEYSSFTHHSNMDTFERLQPDDMRKNATIAAIFAFLTANRDDLLPRKPMRQ